MRARNVLLPTLLTLVACKGAKIEKEAQLIAAHQASAIEAGKAGDIEKFSQDVGMIDGAVYRLNELGADEVEGMPTADYLKKVRTAIVTDVGVDSPAFERAFLASSDRYGQSSILEFVEKADKAKSDALRKKLESRPRVLVRGASAQSAEPIVKKYQKSHPHLRWIQAEGHRDKDTKQKVALILDFEEAVDVKKLITYEKTDVSGRPTGGNKYHALSGYGVKLTVRWIETKRPDGLDDPTVLVAAKSLGQPKEFRGSGKTSAASKFTQHQARTLTAASAELHEALTQRFLKEIAPKIW